MWTDSKDRQDAATRQHHVIIEDGEATVVLETPAKVMATTAAVSRSASSGAAIGASHKDMLRLLRAKFAERGVTVDCFIDTMEAARTKATTRDGLPDHKMRLEAVRLEATMLGIIGTSALAAVEETKAEHHAAFTRADLAGKDKRENISEILRRIEIAKSKGALRDEDVEVNPDHVDKLAAFSRASVGEDVGAVVSLKTRRGTKIDPRVAGVLIESDLSEYEKSAEEKVEKNGG